MADVLPWDLIQIKCNLSGYNFSDVDEIACLVDFGVKEEIVLANLENLNVVRIIANPKPLADVNLQTSARSGEFGSVGANL